MRHVLHLLALFFSHTTFHTQDYEKDLGGEEEKVDSPDSIRYSFKSPMDNLVVRTFQFPMWYDLLPILLLISCLHIPNRNDSMAKLDVTEVMGEGRFSFSIPIQLMLVLYCSYELLIH